MEQSFPVVTFLTVLSWELCRQAITAIRQGWGTTTQLKPFTWFHACLVQRLGCSSLSQELGAHRLSCCRVSEHASAPGSVPDALDTRETYPQPRAGLGSDLAKGAFGLPFLPALVSLGASLGPHRFDSALSQFSLKFPTAVAGLGAQVI